jgi:hypothetical protein
MGGKQSIGVIKNNQKARQNPKALAQLDGYKRPLVGSLSANRQRFGMEKVAKLESLQDIIAEMTDDDGTGAIRTQISQLRRQIRMMGGPHRLLAGSFDNGQFFQNWRR